MQSEVALQRQLHLIVLSTEQCNFRCSYCYEAFERYNIDESVLESLAHLISKRLPNLDALHVGWFGGEPLINTRPISIIGATIRENIRRGTKVTSSVSTNGSLLDERTLTLLRNNFVKQFQISLDGSQTFHDSTRLTRKGEGSYKIVQSALNTLHKCTDPQLRVRVRIHLTQENLGSIEQLISDLLGNFGRDERFQLHIKAVERLGGNNGKTFSYLSDKSQVDEIKMLAKNSGLSVSDTGESACYAAMPNSFVVRTDGAILKCTVALDDKRNIVGWIGRDGLDIDQEKFGAWIDPFLTGDITGMKCPASRVMSFP
ncbi:radical SAM protein [Paracoccus sp. R12_1]|uniref:radical SAM protein n=1 Tax=unclassified Paracoccus (in: a-proteobacteria) TaxID=2688777 RepID=UPI001ADB1481|nr:MULTISPECIES: radical SAM protein [unclassified Paracoccus (in: a-proteobacteria)]MBO9457387.1 radical SAM protein [Paracoccus sp. R12_2]MBO9488656.1 radical SAM protein [Paracoccus sp. R12_1]